MTKFLAPFRDTRVCACGDHGFTGLTRGMVAFCDPEDVPLLSGRFWCIEGKWPRRYAMSRPNGGERYAHRIVCKAESGKPVDHISGDTLDNRKRNLRSCSTQQNLSNQRGHSDADVSLKGVSREGRKYRAKICVNYRQINLGTFSSAEEAARAYDEAANQLHGDFARTNEMLRASSGQNAQQSDRGR